MEPTIRRVIVESPYAGDVEANLAYLRRCMRDCLKRQEAPFASHGLYTQSGVLDDNQPLERILGIAAGFVWRHVAELTVFYVDRGWSRGMEQAKLHCEQLGLPYEVRKLEE